MKRRRPTGRPAPLRQAALLSLALSSASLPRPAHAKKWKYDADQCGLLLSVASSADANGSGGLDSAEAGAFHADLLAKGAATKEADAGPEDWWFDESVCSCKYTYKLDWACCDDTASIDDLKLDGDEGVSGLVFPFGEIPLPDYVVSSNPGNEDWTGQRTHFERKFCKEMFKIVEKRKGSYDLDMSLGAQPTTTDATTTEAPVTTTEAAAESTTTSTAAATTTAATTTTEEATTTSTTAPPQTTTEATTTPEPSTTNPPTTPGTPPADDPPPELDQRPASLSSINDGDISNVRSAAGSDGGGEISAGAFVGIALATLLVLLLASALIVRRRRRRLRGDEDAVRHQALNDSTEMGGGDGPPGGELWHDGESDGGGGGDGARTSSAAGTLAAMGVASTVATRLTTGESEVMLTERRGWSRNEPDV